jgi:hypothetical protein
VQAKAGKTEARTRSNTRRPRRTEQEALDLRPSMHPGAERGEKRRLELMRSRRKRRKPGFNESYGYRSFSDLLKDAETRQLLA